MATVEYIQPDGSSVRAEATEGTNLMKLALANDVAGVVGECGGELSCGTCHLYVAGEWNSKLEPQSPDEVDLIEIMDSYRPGESRLGCQIRFRGDLDGMCVVVAPDN